MQLIDDLREAADQLEKEAGLIHEAKAIVKEFHIQFLAANVTKLDALHVRATALLKEIGEL